MTYTEWRDELKSNLLNVSESERRRVLDYYAEAYADRREAGFTEREIIQDFGAPYDAAQRILYDKTDDFYEEPPARPETAEERTRRDIRRENREARREEQARREEMKREEMRRRDDMRREEQARRDEQRKRDAQARGNMQYEYAQNGYGQYGYAPPPPPPQPAPVAAQTAQRGNYSWLFVLLCIVFAIPLFGLIMAMVGITVGFIAAPVAVIGSGAAYIGMSIGTLISGQIASGFYQFSIGLIIFGVGVALCPIFFKLIQIMWKLFKKVFTWLKNVFSGKEAL